MKKVLLLETVPEEVFKKLANSAHVLECYTYKEALKNAESEDIAAIVTRGKGNVSSELIDNCPNLEVIARCGVGLDNVNVSYASKKGVKVVNAPGSNADTMAEHTIGLMLMGMRQLFTSIEEVNRGNWVWRNKYSGDEIRGKTLGIIGMGNIGQKVAVLAAAFGMKVIYWDVEKKDCIGDFMNQDQILRNADVISLHMPLLESTKNFINTEKLSKMKNNAWIINAARGGLIDKDALLEALDNNKISGYAADVVESEPPDSEDPLIKHPRTFITPHSGSLTATTYYKMCDMTVENVIAILNGNTIDQQFIFNRNDL